MDNKLEKTSRVLIVCILAVVFSLVSVAQDKGKDKGKTDKIDKQTKLLKETYSQFVYDQQGRRDPFVNLLIGRGSGQVREKLAGVAGLIIAEIELRGITSVRGEYVALIKAPDNQPHYLRVGDRLYDGTVEKINFSSVIFRRKTPVVVDGTKIIFVTKRVNPEKEGIDYDQS